MGIETSALLGVSSKFSSKVAANGQFYNYMLQLYTLERDVEFHFPSTKVFGVQGVKSMKHTALWMPSSFQRKDLMWCLKTD